MILDDPDLLTDEDDPLGLTGSPTPEDLRWREHLEQVRIRCVAVFSSSPLYQERAERDPDYWDDFSMGIVNLSALPG